MIEAGFIREVEYPNWLANVMIVPKKDRKWRVCVDYTDEDNFLLLQIDQIVDTTTGHGMLLFLDAFFKHHQIPMHSPNFEKTAFITS